MDEAEQMQWVRLVFEFEHLPQPLRDVSQTFHDAAVQVMIDCPLGAERTVALRKLLEAKDAAVRSVIIDNGGRI